MQSHQISGIADPAKEHTILDNPVYRKSPFYPFAESVRKKDANVKKTKAVVEDLYSKIKQTYKEKMTD